VGVAFSDNITFFCIYEVVGRTTVGIQAEGGSKRTNVDAVSSLSIGKKACSD
jgi:hypothetical protein